MILALFNDIFGAGESHQIVCVGRYMEIAKAFHTDTLSFQFGGYIVYKDCESQRFLALFSINKN